jgi:hypothetical protein
MLIIIIYMRLKDTNIKKKKTQKNIVIVNTTFQQVSNNFLALYVFVFYVLPTGFMCISRTS